MHTVDYCRLKLITLCGVDGSGKTTQIMLLSKSLASKGIKQNMFGSVGLFSCPTRSYSFAVF
jgi:thymidylate kinase